MVHGIFNAYDGMIGSRDSEWFQEAIYVIISLFRMVGLMANVSKSNTMTCQSWAVHMGMSEESVS